MTWASQSDSFPVRLDSDSVRHHESLDRRDLDLLHRRTTTGGSAAGGKPEGRGAISPIDGTLLWVNDCHGDSYSAFPIGQVLYSAGHAHDCQPMGAFPEVESPHLAPRTGRDHLCHRDQRPGTNGYASFEGLPSGTQLDWYPEFSMGSYTGKHQAGWSVTGNANFVSYGGEFPKVNGVPQQGLVRFAISSIAPNRYGPVAYTSAAYATGVDEYGGTAVTVKTTWDPDNAVLEYKIFRNGGSVPVYTTSVDTRFWRLPTFRFVDNGGTLSSGNTYKVVVTDPFGNTTTK